MTKNYFCEIEEEIEEMNLGVEVISCDALSIPNFSFEKYIEIKNNVPTIFANNCWAGLLYHRLRLPFNSPFINMFLNDDDYLRFLEEPQKYINSELVFKETAYDTTLNREYPKCQCGDIYLNFNHYNDFEHANEAWKKRCKRINWDNIFVMMYTNDKTAAERFAKLPYEKKVCFVPFDMDEKDIVPIMLEDDAYFFEIVNGIVTGKYFYFDILDMLMGNYVKIIT